MRKNVSESRTLHMLRMHSLSLSLSHTHTQSTNGLHIHESFAPQSACHWNTCINARSKITTSRYPTNLQAIQTRNAICRKSITSLLTRCIRSRPPVALIHTWICFALLVKKLQHETTKVKRASFLELGKCYSKWRWIWSTDLNRNLIWFRCSGFVALCCVGVQRAHYTFTQDTLISNWNVKCQLCELIPDVAHRYTKSTTCNSCQLGKPRQFLILQENLKFKSRNMKAFIRFVFKKSKCLVNVL